MNTKYRRTLEDRVRVTYVIRRLARLLGLFDKHDLLYIEIKNMLKRVILTH